jgi:ankyrin repeat protein
MTASENALFGAAYRNDVDALAREIRAGADPNVQHPRAGTLPLQLACEANALDAIRFLLENGANPSLSFSRQSRVDGRWFLNWTPLMFALSVAAADLMVQAGANLEAQDGQGWTALVHAIRGKDAALVNYFLEHGASTAVQPRLGDRTMNLLEFVEDDVTFLKGLPASAAIEQRLEALAKIKRMLEQRMNPL